MPQSFADQFKSISMSPNLAQSLERAHGFAREQAHRAVRSSICCWRSPRIPKPLSSSRPAMSTSSGLARMFRAISAVCSRTCAQRTAPSLDPIRNSLRVLQAAVQAAQQSRRRQIDGAIVLAAVVGDGKSPAAGLLKSHGLTFEEAIRALQKASAQLRSQKFATPPAAAAQAETGHVESTPAPTGGESASPAHSTPKPQGHSQSVDDILAAARARIQQRSTTPVGKGDSKPPAAESAVV